MPAQVLQYNIILFDGVCNLCSSSIQFIIKRDKKQYFRFASLQSETAKEIFKSIDIPLKSMESIVLIENKTVYVQSMAALRIAKKLGGLWPLVYYIGRMLPHSLRDTIYNWVARNRYKWFGKKDSCMLPAPGIQHRFLQ